MDIQKVGHSVAGGLIATVLIALPSVTIPPIREALAGWILSSNASTAFSETVAELVDDRLATRSVAQTGGLSFEAASGGGTRGHRGRRVQFAVPFASPPKVVAALRNLDIGNDANTRVQVSISNVTTEGFDYEFTTWADTRVHHAGAVWIAVAETAAGQN